MWQAKLIKADLLAELLNMFRAGPPTAQASAAAAVAALAASREFMAHPISPVLLLQVVQLVGAIDVSCRIAAAGQPVWVSSPVAVLGQLGFCSGHGVPLLYAASKSVRVPKGM